MTNGRAELDLLLPSVLGSRSVGAEEPPARLLVVLGMHRSGTSAVAELLGRNGFDLGPSDRLRPATPTNLHGHFENLDINDLNDAILSRLGGSWSEPPTTETVAGAADDLAGDLRESWLAIRRTYGERPVIKDPRFSLLLPIWRLAFREPPLFIVCVRNPVAVVRSLLARDGLEPHLGAVLWEAYNLAALRGLAGGRALFVNVDDVLRSGSRRQQLVDRLRVASAAPSEVTFEDTFDETLFGGEGREGELAEYLTTAQFTLYRRLTALPDDVVVVDDLQHLRLPAASHRLLTRRKLEERTKIDVDELEAQLERERRVVGQLREQLTLAGEAVQSANEQLTTLREHQQAARDFELKLELKTLAFDELRSAVLDLERERDTAAAGAASDRALHQRLTSDVEAERSAVAGLTIQLQALASERDAAVAELEKAAAAVAASEAAERQSTLRAEDAEQLATERAVRIEKLTAEAAMQQAALSRLECRVNELTSECARLSTEAESTHALYGAVFESRTWRWTRFLRAEKGGTDD